MLHILFWVFHFNYLADFQKSSEQIAKLQKLHEEKLASKEQELTKKFQTQEREFQEQMKVAVVSIYFVFAVGKLSVLYSCYLHCPGSPPWGWTTGSLDLWVKKG